MIEMTQKILALDSEAETALKNSAASVLEAMKEADLHAKGMIEEQQQLFEKQKESERAALAEKLERERHRSVAALQQKMEAFEASVDIDVLIGHLLSVAKERVCH